MKAMMPILGKILNATLGILLLILPIQSACTLSADLSQAKISDCVILLHGLGRTSDSMEDMAAALEAAGFNALNLDYPSREHPIENLAREAIERGLHQCRNQGGKKIHFVTHSMRGILVRYYLSRHVIQELGRVVMLSPPNQGSEAVDVLKDDPFYQWILGTAGQQLGTDPEALVFRFGPVTYPVGIITGNKSTWFDTWLSDDIPGDDDGKVSVERAKVEGMSDFLVLPHGHTFIMNNQEVIEQTIYFLQHGRFQTRGKTDDKP